MGDQLLFDQESKSYRWYSRTSGYYGPVFTNMKDAEKWRAEFVNSF